MSSSQFPRRMKIIIPGRGRWNSKMVPKISPPWYTCTFFWLSNQTACSWIWTLLLSCSVTSTNVLYFPNSQFSHLYPHLRGNVEWRRDLLHIPPASMHEWLTPRLSWGVRTTPYTEQLKSEVARVLGMEGSRIIVADIPILPLNIRSAACSSAMRWSLSWKYRHSTDTDVSHERMEPWPETKGSFIKLPQCMKGR